jgi:hypothetical protein
MRKALITSALLLLPLWVLAQKAPTPTPGPKPVEPPIDTTTVERILRGDEAVDNGQGFTYDPAGRRDPFRSLLKRGSEREDLGVRPSGLAGMGIEEVRFVGIFRLPEGYVAMIQGTDGLSYLLNPGDVLYDGTVDRVEQGRVVFRMQVTDPKSLKPYREVVRTLQ